MKPIIYLLTICISILSFTPSAMAGKKKKKDYIVTISTTYGDMTFVLYDDTPLHKKNFIKLAQEGFYDGTTFHRVIQNFMIQGGDPYSKDNNPMNDGQGGPGYTIPAEFKDHQHVKGALAAARRGDMVNPKKESSGSQFYIVHNEKGTPHLDGSYTVFGQLIQGFNVLDSIANQPTGQMDRPDSAIKITVKVELLKLRKIKKTYGYTYKKEEDE